MITYFSVSKEPDVLISIHQLSAHETQKALFCKPNKKQGSLSYSKYKGKQFKQMSIISPTVKKVNNLSQAYRK